MPHDHSDAPAVIRDPVCGMTVDPSAGKPSAEHGGHRYHFCSAGCREKFMAAPQDYLTAADPVCGMEVDRSAAQHMLKHGGQRHYFCSENCRSKFEADPEAYLGGRPAPEPMPAGTVYTCPMHPEIRQDHPGDCPKCGMALEPETPTAESGPNPEYVDFRRRLAITAPLAAAVFVLEMGAHLGIPFADWIGHSAFGWVQFLLATPVVWICRPFFKRGWASVVNRSPNMWTLIALGTGAAYLFSVVSLIAPGLFPAAMRDGMGMAPVYFEAAAVILVLVLVGQVMELAARERTGDAIRALLDLAPKTARRVTDSGEEDVPLDEVAAGDLQRAARGPRPLGCGVDRLEAAAARSRAVILREGAAQRAAQVLEEEAAGLPHLPAAEPGTEQEIPERTAREPREFQRRTEALRHDQLVARMEARDAALAFPPALVIGAVGAVLVQELDLRAERHVVVPHVVEPGLREPLLQRQNLRGDALHRMQHHVVERPLRGQNLGEDLGDLRIRPPDADIVEHVMRRRLDRRIEDAEAPDPLPLEDVRDRLVAGLAVGVGIVVPCAEHGELVARIARQFVQQVAQIDRDAAAAEFGVVELRPIVMQDAPCAAHGFQSSNCDRVRAKYHASAWFSGPIRLRDRLPWIQWSFIIR